MLDHTQTTPHATPSPGILQAACAGVGADGATPCESLQHLLLREVLSGGGGGHGLAAGCLGSYHGGQVRGVATGALTQ